MEQARLVCLLPCRKPRESDNPGKESTVGQTIPEPRQGVVHPGQLQTRCGGKSGAVHSRWFLPGDGEVQAVPCLSVKRKHEGPQAPKSNTLRRVTERQSTQ